MEKRKIKGKEIFGNKEDICEPSFKINNLVLIFGGSYLSKDTETSTPRVNHGRGSWFGSLEKFQMQSPEPAPICSCQSLPTDSICQLMLKGLCQVGVGPHLRAHATLD